MITKLKLRAIWGLLRYKRFIVVVEFERGPTELPKIKYYNENLSVGAAHTTIEVINREIENVATNDHMKEVERLLSSKKA